MDRGREVGRVGREAAGRYACILDHLKADSLDLHPNGVIEEEIRDPFGVFGRVEPQTDEDEPARQYEPMNEASHDTLLGNIGRIPRKNVLY